MAHETEPTDAGDRPLRIAEGTLVVLVGPPASGKSTWAARHFPPHQVVSSDSLRSVLGTGEHDQRASKDAFDVLDLVIERRLRRGLTTVVDTLGTDVRYRRRWLRVADDAGRPCVAVVFDTDPATCRARNRTRDRSVPASVMRSMLARWPEHRATIEADGFTAVHTADTSDIASPTAARPAADTSDIVAQPPTRPTAGTSDTSDIARQAAGHQAAVPVAPTVEAAGTTATRHTVPDVTVVAADLVAAPAAAARQQDAPIPLAFGLQVPRFTFPGGPAETRDRLTELAAAAEQAGFSSLWVMDHFLQIPQVDRHWEDMLESWTTLAFLAARTDELRLGTLVTGVTYRNIAHLAKIVATLDVLSGGRAVCGIGAAWFEREHRAYGWPFPTLAERYAMLEDALELLPLMWGKGAPPYSGRTIEVAEAVCYPRPLQERIPILVGGSGERRTLRLVARYADACNVFGNADTVRRKVDVLHRHCEHVGRDPAAIEVTVLSTADAPTVQDHVGRYRSYAEAGVDTVIVSLPELTSAEPLRRFAEVVAAFRT